MPTVVELVKLVQVQAAVQVQVGGQGGQTSVMTKISISHGGKGIKLRVIIIMVMLGI